MSRVGRLLRFASQRLIPRRVRIGILSLIRDVPPVGGVRFGHLRRMRPISQQFGYDRGQPIDRYYIDKFLTQYASDVRGRVLEVGHDFYTKQYGGARVTQGDVLHYIEGNPIATIVADLTCADQVPSDSFDCIICTQTIQMIYDQHAALKHLFRMLKPEGVLLVTTHGTSRIGRHRGVDPWGCYWHMTSQGADLFFAECFPRDRFKVHSYGNFMSAISFLAGVAAEELKHEELDTYDRDFEVLVAVRAVKPVRS